MCWNDITLFSFVWAFTEAAVYEYEMSISPFAFLFFYICLQTYGSESPAALLSISAADLTNQGSRSMSPFVTCHWGTSWAAGTPSGVFSARRECCSCQSQAGSHLSDAVPLGPATQMSPLSCLGGFDLWSTHLERCLHSKNCLAYITLRNKSDDQLAHLGIEIPLETPKMPCHTAPMLAAHSLHYFKHPALIPSLWH